MSVKRWSFRDYLVLPIAGPLTLWELFYRRPNKFPWNEYFKRSFKYFPIFMVFWLLFPFLSTIISNREAKEKFLSFVVWLPRFILWVGEEATAAIGFGWLHGRFTSLHYHLSPDLPDLNPGGWNIYNGPHLFTFWQLELGFWVYWIAVLSPWLIILAIVHIFYRALR